jgi:hydrogenase-4 component F
MMMEIWLTAIFVTLGVGVALCLKVSKPGAMLRIPVITAALTFLLGIAVAFRFQGTGTYTMYRSNFIIDPLALYHIFLVNLIFLISSIYATGYFSHAVKSGTFALSYARRFCMLWQTYQAMLLLVLLSNNIGIMWVALEATTLVSAFLILSDGDSLSIEAMWKYLLICSVGIVFAFMGTLLTVAASSNPQAPEPMYLFSQLNAHANLIDPRLMLFAFIFIVVGFGTKAGLSPMHTWLPDAHSQAPTPVSTVFSGVMLNCALFCIMRYLPITEAALGHDGQAHTILLLLGLLSLVFSAVFIPVQHDMKRFLAYCSVEHIGIIAVGLGMGGAGVFAALLHTLNHSLAKTLSFFSAGHIGNYFGTRDMRRISGAIRAIPLWGMAFFIAILVLIGVAPFSVFMSEFLIVKAAFVQGKYVVVGLFFFCALAVFFSALKFALGVSFGANASGHAAPQRVRRVDVVIVLAIIGVLLMLGVWIPTAFTDFLKNAAAAVEQGIRL